MRCLVIVSDTVAAKKQGMSPATRHHQTTPELQFWWLGLTVDKLRGVRFDVIVETVWVRPSERAYIRANCTYPDTIWVEGTIR